MGLLLAAASAAAQPGLTLRDAVAATLRHSPETADARLAVEVSGAEALAAEAPFDLHLEANWQFSEAYAPVYLASINRSTIFRLRDLSFDQSLVRRFSTGTEIGIEYLSLTETVFGGGSSGMGDFTLSRETVQLRLAQSLLRGAGISANLAPVRAARLRTDAARQAQRARLAELLRTVETGYWELVYAERELEILGISLDAARKHVEEARRRVRAGRLAPADVLVVERAVAVAADELVAADGRRRARAQELARWTGVESAALPATDRPTAAGALRPQGVLEAARAAPAVGEAEALRQAREEDAAAQENGALPRLDLVATLGPSGERQTVGDALSAMASFDEVAWSVGVLISWAPGGAAESAAAARAKAERRRAALAREIARRDLEDRARKLLAAVDAAARRIELARTAVDLARRAQSAEQARFEVGTVPAKNVLDRQVELAQAELRLARVETDLVVARAELDALTGANLERYGIR